MCKGVLAHGNQGTMNNRDKYLGECVICAREQVCRSRKRAGIGAKVKVLMPGLHSRGHSALTTCRANRLHLDHHKNASNFETLALEANGCHLHSTHTGLILETVWMKELKRVRITREAVSILHFSTGG